MRPSFCRPRVGVTIWNQASDRVCSKAQQCPNEDRERRRKDLRPSFEKVIHKDRSILITRVGGNKLRSLIGERSSKTETEKTQRSNDHHVEAHLWNIFVDSCDSHVFPL